MAHAFYILLFYIEKQNNTNITDFMQMHVVSQTLLFFFFFQTKATPSGFNMQKYFFS